MSNRPRYERRLRDSAIEQLLQILNDAGQITSQQWQAASEASTYSVRHLKRIMKTHVEGAAQEGSYTLGENEITAIYLAGGRLKQAHRHLLAEGIELPSARHFSRIAHAQLGSVILGYARGGERLARTIHVTVPFEEEHRGQTYELDHTELPIWIIPRGRTIQAVRPWLTVAIDRQTRYVVGWVITIGRPSAAEVAACIAQGCMFRQAPDGKTMVGGVPERVVWDRGLEFLAASITEMCQRQRIMPFPLPAYTPEGKARLERFWRFLKEDCLSDLPGYIDSHKDLAGKPTTTHRLLGEKEFVRILEEWLSDYVTAHVVSTMGVTPLGAWQRDQTPLRTVPSEVLWQDFLVSKAKVKVSKNGVRFDTIDFVAPELTDYVGRHVEIRYLPHDRTFIEVFADGAHVCTAWPRHALDADTRQEVIAHRSTSVSEAKKWGRASSRRRYAGHDESYPMEQDKRGRLRVKEASNDSDLVGDVEDAFPDEADPLPGPGIGQGRMF